MKFPDYIIIAAVAGLFMLAFAAYKKKPRCACGKSGGCGGNCGACCQKHNHCK